MSGGGRKNSNGRGWLPGVALLLLGLITAGCAPAGPGVSASPRATSFEEFATGFCSAFDSLFKAVGNPDTGGGSDLSNRLAAAAAARDVATAQVLATQITSELEAGRRSAAFAGGWAPGAPTAAHLDRFLLAYEAWTSAFVESAQLGPDAARAQDAFEQAGGLDAWRGMFEAMREMAPQRPVGDPHKCPTVPVSL